MSKPKKTADTTANLRKRAEKKLGTQLERLQKLSAKGTRDLVQELGTHQIELEMQNEELRKAQEALEASRDRYADLYDFAPVGYLTFDQAGVIREANLTAATLLNVPRRTLINKPFAAFVGKSDSDAFHLHCATLLETRTKQTLEIRLNRRDRTGFYALLESIVVEDPDGNAVALRTSISDISDRRKIEEALQRSELRYRSLFENMLDGYAYCRMLYDKSRRPSDFVFLAVNSAFERLTGLKDVVGRRASDVIPGIRQAHPELLETVTRIISTGKTEKFERRFEPLKMWFSVALYSTEREHFTAIFDDISARKEAVFALGRSEEKYRLLFENMAEGFALYELLYDETGTPSDWRMLEANDAYVLHTGIACETLIGRRISEIHPDAVAEYLPLFARVVGTGTPEQFETYAKVTGRLLQIITFPAGKDRFASTITDITARKQAEADLRASEAKYRSLFDNLIDGFALHRIITDGSGKPVDYVFLEVNTSFERLTGLNRAAIIGRRATDVIPGIESDPADWIGRYGQVALTGEKVRFEQFAASLGRWYSISAYSPQKGFFATVFEEVTERKQAVEALRESREDLNRAQEVGGIGSWRLDVRKNVLTWSEENHRIFGIPTGTPLTYETFLSTVHPDDRSYVDDRWRAALQGEPYDVEHRISVHGGTRWVREKAYLEFDADGSLLGGFGITQDITERKRVEDELRTASDRYRSFIEVTGQLGWTTNAAGAVVEDIPSWRAYTGQAADEIMGWGWTKALHEDDIEQTRRIWTDAVSQKRPYDTEYRLRRHDGIYRHFLARGIPLLSENGAVREWVGTCIDITERKKAEEALQKLNADLEQRVEERTRELRIANDTAKTERQRLFDVLETLPVYVILLDKDYRIPFANRFFRERFGESLDRRCYEYLYKRTEPCENCETFTVFKTSAPHHWYWTGPDRRNYDIYDFPFVDTDGSTLILEMGIDITEQKSAQDALRRTINELTEAERRTMLVNELLLLFTREQDRAAFLARAVELIRQWSGCRHVDIQVVDDRGILPSPSCAGFGEAFRNPEQTTSLQNDTCACTRVVHGIPEPQDLPAMTPGGSFYSNNTARFVGSLSEQEQARFRGVCVRNGFLSVAVVPIRYRDRILGAIHVADELEDMVPLAVVEFLEQVALIIGETLFRFGVEQESTRLAAAVESAADAVAVTDAERGTILYVNDSFVKMTGYSREESVGKDLHLLDSGRQGAAFFAQIRAAMQRDGVWRGRLVNKKKDGTLYFEDCTFSPVRDQTGHILNYVSIKRDVTERLRLETIAESVSMMDNIGSVFAGVRHEIGNPINNVKMMLAVLQRKTDLPPSRVREYIERSLAEISRVEHLLRTLKTFNLFEAPVLTDHDTASVMDLFLGLVREDMRARGIAISLSILPGADRIRTDSRALQHVLLNLTTNAADALAGREDPRIYITLSRDADRVHIRISDNGCGMTEEQKESLFKPFHTTKPHGTGLGLVIVKKMLASMNGSIEITSHHDSGTIVNVYLPGGGNHETT